MAKKGTLWLFISEWSVLLCICAKFTCDCLKYSIFLVRAKWLLWKQEPGWEMMDFIPWYGTRVHLCYAYELRNSEAERNAQTKVWFLTLRLFGNFRVEVLLVDDCPCKGLSVQRILLLWWEHSLLPGDALQINRYCWQWLQQQFWK